MSSITTNTNVALNTNQDAEIKNIAIYDKTQKQEILTGLQFIDGSVDINKKLMEHPKEDGTLITDHSVDDPTKVTLQVLLSDGDTDSLNEVLDLYKNSTPVTIKLKNELHSNLVMASKPLQADSDHYNSTVYNLTFKEIQEAVTLYVKMSVPQVKKKSNASKVNTGHKQTQQPKKSPSILRQGWNLISGKK